MRQVQVSSARSPQKSSPSRNVAARPFAVDSRTASAGIERATRLGHSVLGPMHPPAPVAQLAAMPRNAESDGTANRLLPQLRPNRTGLPDTLKMGIERLSGISLDQVRVHYRSSQPATLNAHAFARGRAIHLAPGQNRHLPHEAWHIVQQAQGRVRPTEYSGHGMAINSDRDLEREADSMASKAIAAPPQSSPAQTAEPVTTSASDRAPTSGVAQRVVLKRLDRNNLNKWVYYSSFETSRVFEESKFRDAEEHDRTLEGNHRAFGWKHEGPRSSHPSQPTLYTYKQTKPHNVLERDVGPHTIAHAAVTSALKHTEMSAEDLLADERHVPSPEGIEAILKRRNMLLNTMNFEYKKTLQEERYLYDYAAIYKRAKELSSDNSTAKSLEDNSNEKNLKEDLTRQLMEMHPLATYSHSKKASKRSLAGGGEKGGVGSIHVLKNVDSGAYQSHPREMINEFLEARRSLVPLTTSSATSNSSSSLPALNDGMPPYLPISSSSSQTSSSPARSTSYPTSNSSSPLSVTNHDVTSNVMSDDSNDHDEQISDSSDHKRMKIQSDSDSDDEKTRLQSNSDVEMTGTSSSPAPWAPSQKALMKQVVELPGKRGRPRRDIGRSSSNRGKWTAKIKN